MNFYGKTIGSQHTLAGRLLPMCEAIRLAIHRASGQPPFQPRFAQALPEWGHNVASELTKTLFKGMVKMAPKGNKIDAYKTGQLVGLLIRLAVHIWKEIPDQIEREGWDKLPPEKMEKLEKISGWELMLPQASELAGRPITDKAELKKFYQRRAMHNVIQLGRSTLRLINYILHRPVEDIFQFLSGLPKGFKAFLKTDGEFAGKGKRTEIFLLLLAYWPEIEEMRQSEPPKTRRYLLEWLEKQEELRLVEDEKVFFAICDDIDLDLTVPGHPFKLAEV